MISAKLKDEKMKIDSRMMHRHKILLERDGRMVMLTKPGNGIKIETRKTIACRTNNIITRKIEHVIDRALQEVMNDIDFCTRRKKFSSVKVEFGTQEMSAVYIQRGHCGEGRWMLFLQIPWQIYRSRCG